MAFPETIDSRAFSDFCGVDFRNQVPAARQGLSAGVRALMRAKNLLPVDFNAVLGALVVQSLLNGGGFIDEVGGLGLVDTVNVQRSGGSGCFLGGSLSLDGGGGFIIPCCITTGAAGAAG